MESTISILFLIIGIYLLFGIVFSVLFLWKGITKVDSGAEGSGLFFKILLFPGMCFFWILFLKKWIKSNKT